MIQTMRPTVLLLTLLSFAGCKTTDPLYCDKNHACTDPARPFCDLSGEYPASDGVARTCIPSPLDAGTEDGDDDSEDGGENAADAGNGMDAGEPADAGRPCSSWSTLTPLGGVNSVAYEEEGSIGPDGLSIVFSSDRQDPGGGNWAIYSAERGSTGEAFGEPVRLAELDDLEVSELDPEISPSGLEIFYHVIPGRTIRTASRDSRTEAFGPAEETGLTGRSPSLSGDGLALYFVNEEEDFTIQRATRKSVGSKWSSPVSVLPTNPYYAVDVSPDELRLLVSTSDSEAPFLVAERSSIDEEFGPPEPLNSEILVPDADSESSHGHADWDGSQTLLVATIQIFSGSTRKDLYYSTCQ
jgi:WD40-like Beta Propeller Repeat